MRVSKLFRHLTFLGIAAFIFISAYLFFYLRQTLAQLPNESEAIRKLSYNSFPISSEVFDRNGIKIGEFVDERRYVIRFDKIPKHVIHAFLSAEDNDFYSHPGVSIKAIIRALFANIRSNKIAQGASTITQQLTRAYFLNKEKILSRKIKEAMLAIMIEQKLDKNQILELYLNKIFLGNHSYGIEAAARNYFRKAAKNLTIGEASLLASLPKAPSYYAPHKHYARARERQKTILYSMYKNHYINKSQLSRWLNKEIKVYPKPKNYNSTAAYFVSEVKKVLAQKFEANDLLNKEGLKIYTTLDFAIQQSVEDVFLKESKSLPITHKNARANGEIQASLLSIDAATGGILALQGGWNFAHSQFNRAFRTKRELGDVFSPLYITYAIDNGYSLASSVDLDSLYTKDKNGSPVTRFPSIYELLLNKKNDSKTVLVSNLGLGTVSKFAYQLGFRFKIKDLRIADGKGSASPLQLAMAYQPIANQGIQTTPYLISKIENRNGHAIYTKNNLPQQRLIRPTTAKIMLDALRDISISVNIPISNNFEETFVLNEVSNNLKNAWIVGFKNKILTTIWVGAEIGRKKIAKTMEQSNSNLINLWTNINQTINSHISQTHQKDQNLSVKQNIPNIGYRQIQVDLGTGKLEKRIVPFDISASKQMKTQL
ncbi:MAG: transglycosylase domain-containing protein [Bdellovibrionota bacterium]